MKNKNALIVPLAAAAAGGLLAATNHLPGQHGSKPNQKSTKTSPEYVRSMNEAKLLKLQEDNPNVFSVAPDPKHPGMMKVTMLVQPGHNTVGALASAINDHYQLDAVESYNGGLDLVRDGESIHADVDLQTGDVVPKPELDNSAPNG